MDAATLRAERRYRVACGVTLAGLAVPTCLGVAHVGLSLAGAVVALVGLAAMAATSKAAGA